MPKLKPDERLRFASMGKLFDITAWFSSDEAANAYLKNHSDEGVIACSRDGLVLIANVYHRGERYYTRRESR